MLSEPDIDLSISVLDRDLYDQNKGTDERPNSFKSSTFAFIKYCIQHPEEKYDIRSTSDRLGFKQRRFHEVVSVFEALGVCTKIDQDTFLWNGFDNIKLAIKHIATNRGVFSPEYSLDEIFNKQGSISVQRITEEFILLFLALELRKINVLEASVYLSRKNEREKTTRCKLYQVSAILEIANIVKKTDNTGEFELLPEYFISASDMMNTDSPNPSDLYSLLNRKEAFCSDVGIAVISSRLKEYYADNY